MNDRAHPRHSPRGEKPNPLIRTEVVAPSSAQLAEWLPRLSTLSQAVAESSWDRVQDDIWQHLECEGMPGRLRWSASDAFGPEFVAALRPTARSHYDAHHLHQILPAAPPPRRGPRV